MMGTRMSATIQKCIIRLAALGKSDREIAEATGYSSQTILRYRHDNDIAPGWTYPGRTHGIAATYRAGCRCDACTIANRVKAREYYRDHLSTRARKSADSETGEQR